MLTPCVLLLWLPSCWNDDTVADVSNAEQAPTSESTWEESTWNESIWAADAVNTSVWNASNEESPPDTEFGLGAYFHAGTIESTPRVYSARRRLPQHEFDTVVVHFARFAVQTS